jgi:hypothetical protein
VLDEPSEVVRKGPLGQVADRSERSVEEHRVGHPSVALHALESVLVAVASEWATDLLVHEGRRTLEIDDARGHGPDLAEMAGAPGHLVSEPDLPARDATDCPLAESGHRLLVRVDAQGQVEDAVDRRSDVRRTPEVGGHLDRA